VTVFTFEHVARPWVDSGHKASGRP